MKVNRRNVFVGSLAAAFALLFGIEDGEAGPRKRKKRRKQRRKVRRRVRRRHRRRVRRRMVGGRPRWVIPVAAAVGWELLLDDKVVVVKETKVVEKESEKVEVLVVVHADGTTEEVEAVREDDDQNGEELEGSELAEADADTPGVEVEVEVEVEVDVE